MGWRSPGKAFERVKGSNTGAQMGIETLLGMIGQAIGKTANEAQSWQNMMGQFEQNLAIANNQEDLDSLMEIIDGAEEQAELYSDVLDDPTYKMSAWSANQKYQNARTSILGYENAMVQIGKDELNVATNFDKEYPKRFYKTITDDSGGEKQVPLEGKEWDKAWMDWQTDMGHAPMVFGTDYADYNTIFNHWIKLHLSDVPDIEKRKYAPLPYMRKQYNKYDKILSNLQNMGVEFEMTPQGWTTGGITNLRELQARGVKMEFEVPYIDENGVQQSQTMSLPELARIAMEKKDLWANFSSGYANQEFNFGGTQHAYDENGDLKIIKTQVQKMNPYSQEEIMRIMTMGEREFDAYALKQQEGLPREIDSSVARISALNQAIQGIITKISTLTKAQADGTALENVAKQLEFNQEEKELLKHYGGQDLKEMSKDLKSLNKLKTELNALKDSEWKRLGRLRIDAVSYGATGNLEAPAPIVEELKDEPKKEEVEVYEGTREQIKEAIAEGRVEKLKDYTSISELKKELGSDYNGFINFYLGHLEDHDINPMTQGKMYAYDDVQLIPSPIINDYEGWDKSNPNQSISKMHPNYSIDKLYLKNDNINNALELYNYNSFMKNLLDETDKFNIMDENILKPNSKDIGILREIHNTGMIDENTPAPVATVITKQPTSIDGIIISSYSGRPKTKVSIPLQEGSQIRILSMSNNFRDIGQLLPSKNIIGESGANVSQEFTKRKNLDGEGFLSNKMLTENYESDFNKDLSNEDFSLMWYNEAVKPNAIIISDAQGNIYLVNSSQFIKGGKEIFIPETSALITVGNTLWDLVNWRVSDSDVMLRNVDSWTDNMFDFPRKINK